MSHSYTVTVHLAFPARHRLRHKYIPYRLRHKYTPLTNRDPVWFYTWLTLKGKLTVICFYLLFFCFLRFVGNRPRDVSTDWRYKRCHMTPILQLAVGSLELGHEVSDLSWVTGSHLADSDLVPMMPHNISTSRQTVENRILQVALLRNVYFSLFTQPPMRRIRICFTDVFFVFLFFPVFFPSAIKYQTTILGNGWIDFHETFTKR